MSSARAVAIGVLSRVEATQAYLNVTLDHQLKASALKDPRDAGLVTELCYGVMRRKRLLDAAIAQHSDRKLDKLEDRVLCALELGAYQLFFTRTPRHAAVAATVEALKELKLSRAAGFVNAVLRKLSGLEALPLPPPEPWAEHVALRESHPRWLVERWERQLGRARAEEVLAANNQPAPVVVRVNRSKRTREALLGELAEAGVEAEPTGLSPVGIRLLSPGPLESLYGYAEGLWQVQDEAAQLVGVYADLPDGARVLDLCAAPGGKTCHLAERLEVLALDLHAHKLPKIQAEAKRLGVDARVTTQAQDASEPLPEAWGEFHAVLVDAPCSGLGTLRRHPELRYRRKEEDIARLASLQRRILEHAQAVVAPGGLLVYAVCSTEPQEGADQVEMFLRSHPDFTAEPPVLSPEVKLPSHQGYLRTLPGPEGMDGFFAARLRRLN